MIEISRSNYNKIIKHCMDMLPYEACGLLAGMEENGVKLIKRVYPVTNADKSSCHFSMDIKEQLAVIKEIRHGNLGLSGNFHSHPTGPPVLSEEDIRLANDFSVEYMVVSLENRDMPVIKAYGISSGRSVTEHDIRII